MELKALRAAVNGISVHRELMETCVMTRVAGLLTRLRFNGGDMALDDYTYLFHALRQEGCEGLGDWLWDFLRYTETPYSRLIDQGKSDPALENAARRDIDTLVLLAQTDCDRFIDAMKPLLPDEFASVLAGLPRWRAAAPFDFDSLTQFYRDHGAGLFAKYRAFLWEDGNLVPVADPDCPKPEDLLGYEHQRGMVEQNTRLMLAGRQANNVLLFGDGGTGKSATVKSMLYLPGMEDLRLIEVEKENLTGMPELIRSLAGRRQKFILFIDDLSFQKGDDRYSALKAVLEGSVSAKSRNVAIYATSNRRHLVRETFSDREGDDVHRGETMQEMISLSERFGLHVTFQKPNKETYLEIVRRLAEARGAQLETGTLEALAERFALERGGRSARAAKQFVDSLLR